MSSYIVNVTNGSDTGTIIPDVGFNYTDKLNDINEGNIKISGTGSVRRGLLAIGSNIEIKKDGTRVFYGLLDNIDYLDGGAINFHISGYEIWLAKKNGTYSNSPYKNTASASIFSDLIGESPKLSAGTIEAGSNIDFRVAKTDSLWNGISNLARKVSQDVQIDYINLEVDVLDHRGSTTSVLTFNDGIDIYNLRKSEAYPLGNKIIVYGKGDGANQITATSSDATSISTYGEITRVVTDRTIMSTSEAQKLADAEKLITKDPVEVYDFDVMNPNQSFIAGDIITLNSTDKDLDNVDVRIVGIERGVRNGVEYLTLQVTNSAYSSLIKKRNDILSKVVKQQRDTDTYMQGSGNTQSWARGINAKLDTPLVIPFYVSSDFVTDEAGNMRIDSLTLDYDVDPYRKGVGDSSETNKAPDFDAVSQAALHGHNPYETGSGHDHTNPATTTGVTLNTQGDSTGNAATQTTSTLTSNTWNTIEIYSNANIALYEALNIHVDISASDSRLLSTVDWSENIATTWDSVASYNYNDTIGIMYVFVEIEADGWSGTDTIGVRIETDHGENIRVMGIEYSTAFDPYRNVFAIPFLTSATGSVYVRLYSSGGRDYSGSVVFYTGGSGVDVDAYFRVQVGSTDRYPDDAGIKVNIPAGCSSSIDIRVPVQAFTASSASFVIEAKPNGVSCNTSLSRYWDKSHKHNIGTYNTNDKVTSLDDTNQSPSVTGKTVLHAHDVSIGDDISDSADINSSEVDLYLDHHEDKAITNNETAGSNNK